MRKFICSDFELDLSVYKITDTAENPWFSGQFFAKYSYPFSVELTPETDILFGLISNFNSTSAETLFEGTYVHGDTIEQAVLEIEECEKALSVTLRYGLEDFPNFTVKLADLPLLKFEVPNIYAHAAGIISQTWPLVNYNFPQVHTDKINPDDDDVWFAFGKIINNYKAGAFLINEVDLTEEITYNRNIMQPVPYLLYLLQAIVQSAGYTLEGDILTDPDLTKTLVYTDADYFTNISQESIQVMVQATEYDTLVPNYIVPHITLSKAFDIPQPGRYRITGHVSLRGRGNNVEVKYQIKYRDTLLTTGSIWYLADGVIEFDMSDVVFETLVDLAPNTVYFIYDGGYNADDVIFDMYINPIALHDDAGDTIPSIINQNEINLARAVPDMTAGDFVKLVLAMKNMDFTIRGTVATMNKIKNEVVNRPIIDLSAYEIKFPNRKFSKGSSWLMGYQDVNSDDYSFAQVFQDVNGIKQSGFTKDDKTTEITINAIPLPLLYRNGVQTAFAFTQDNSKPQFIIYDGITNGLNLAKDPSRLLIPVLHQENYRDWLTSQIANYGFTWTFTAFSEALIGLDAKSRVHAYANIHLVKTIQKTEVSPDLFELEIETKVIE